MEDRVQGSRTQYVAKKSEPIDNADAEDRATIGVMENMEADKPADQVSIAQIISPSPATDVRNGLGVRI
jgi:hypothetical protein